ncbi:MAG: c-type cytochrome [Candidatus Omnitrophica bacterium]|nr:c-type cytochrome [Candidatus Omnitrophota bacterium]
MPPKPPTLYDLKKTTFWFAWASIILLVSLVAMVLQDSTREWKGWQRKFMQYQKQMAETDLAAVKKSIDQKKLDELKAELTQAQAAIKQHKKEMRAIQKDISKLELKATKVQMTYQELKQLQDSDRYFFEEYRKEGRKKETSEYEHKIAKRDPGLNEAKLKVEEIQAQIDEKNTALKQWTDQADKVSKDIKRLVQDQTAVEKKVKKFSFHISQEILNAPMLDFISPSLQVQQIVVEHLSDDYYFTKVQKVDRCITCHLGIDQKGLENAPAPFKTHPRLDLFLSPDSPHPMETFGCTVCHGGSGHSLSFTTASHTPQNEEEQKAWEKKYHWEPMHHWADKMLPMNHVEASCAKCHTGVMEVPSAPKLNEGRNLARTFGCFGCHEVKGFDQPWKAGPSLLHVQSKLDQDWIVRWLHNPKEFRASTHMPQIFHLSNTLDPESKAKSDAAIAGIAAYLIKNSEAVSLQTPASEGNPEIGERLVKELGCLGCHSVGDMKANNFGPELSGLGSKVKADWLFTWLKNPKHYSPGTRMPDLRLSDEEASNIVNYLLKNKNEKFESISLPHSDPAVVDQLAMTFMTGKMRFQDAKTELEKMSPNERLEFVGKQSIAHQGCFGCHDIKGFETSKPIGTELTEEGSKGISKLDYGFIPIEHTREAFFSQKLKEPRIFDEGKEKIYHDKLRMPQFGFSDEQIEALTTFLLSLQKAEIPLEMRRRLNLKEEQIEQGRRIVAEFNCQGCHTLDGKEGKLRSLLQDMGNAPPILDGEGKKVQEKWLYQFLDHPTPIRPWLTYRMPTFGFDDTKIATVIQYFHNLADAPTSYKPEAIEPTSEEIATGRELFRTFQCIKCHQAKAEGGLTASFLAPDLVIAKDRLRAGWVLDWIKDPQAIQEGTMMPGFFPDGQSPAPNILGGDAAKQIKAIRDYLWHFTPDEAAAMTPGKSATGPK